MRVQVAFAGRIRTLVMPKNANVLDAIKKVGANPETVIPKRGKEILLENEALKNDDSLELIKIVSGG